MTQPPSAARLVYRGLMVVLALALGQLVLYGVWLAGSTLERFLLR